MKRKTFVAVACLVTFLVWLCWFCKEHAYAWPDRSTLEIRTVQNQRFAEIAYASWLMGGEEPLQRLRSYAGTLALLVDCHDNDSAKLNAYAELRLINGRMALVARKSGDEEGYAQYMQSALAASSRYAGIMIPHGVANYGMQTEAEIIELVEWIDAGIVRLIQQLSAEEAQAQAAAAKES